MRTKCKIPVPLELYNLRQTSCDPVTCVCIACVCCSSSGFTALHSSHQTFPSAARECDVRPSPFLLAYCCDNLTISIHNILFITFQKSGAGISEHSSRYFKRCHSEQFSSLQRLWHSSGGASSLVRDQHRPRNVTTCSSRQSVAAFLYCFAM
jgi:hypothetical protein